MAPFIAIVVLNWNQREKTATCLRSLEKIDYSSFEVIVVDNGSTDDSIFYFQTYFPKYTLLETGKNLGYAGGNNVGLAYALSKKADYIFILNNDTTVDSSILNHFLNGFQVYPKAGVFGAKIYLMEDPIRFDHLGGMWDKKGLDFILVGKGIVDDGIKWEKSIELDYVCGAGLMISRKALEKVGYFDPRFFLFCEETDWCFRARRAGFEVRTCPKAKIWHEGSASLQGKKPYADYYAIRNRLLWMERNFRGKERLFSLSRFLWSRTWQGIRKICIASLFSSLKKNSFPKEIEFQRHRARMRGVFDYVFRRFGPAPLDVIKNRKI